eukprot:3053039-Amphidinium_carterae.1
MWSVWKTSCKQFATHMLGAAILALDFDGYKHCRRHSQTAVLAHTSRGDARQSFTAPCGQHIQL